MSKTTSRFTYKILFYLSFASFVGVVLLYFNLKNTKPNPTLQLEEIQMQIEDLKKEKETLLNIIKLDEILISKENTEEALRKYEAISSEAGSELNKALSLRIKYSKEVLASNNDDEISKINLRTQLANVLSENDSITNQLDSLKGSLIVNQTLQSKSFDSLSQKLEQVTKELARKDAKQVISFVNENGNLIHYLGEVKDGKANGGGIGIWNTGSIYKGQWKNNMRHGTGEFKWVDGQIYEGEFANDIRSGEGIYYWPSGEKYKGEFAENKMNGQGILYDPDGNKKYEGEWKNDKPKQ